MIGWRARIGFLVPPGNPTVEPEITSLAIPGVSVHFTRMTASGKTGSLSGQEERNRQQIEGLDQAIMLLSLVRPKVVVMAHTATSYTLGKQAEAALTERIEAKFNLRFITAFGSILAGLRRLGISRVAFGTPYDEETTTRGKAALEDHGLTVVSHGTLPGVENIYDETAERAYGLGKLVDCPDAEAVVISGVGMPTLAMIATLEQDIGKPVLSASAAMAWHALATAGIRTPLSGFGRLLASLG